MGLFDRWTPQWDIGIFENRLTIFDTKSGQAYEREAVHHFSTGGLLVANDEILEHELRQLIKQITPKSRWLGFYPVMKVTSFEKPVSATERKTIWTALANAGASNVILPGDAG